ncbi:Serine/Threonine protein kinases active-site signature [Nakaseomyces glabratus]|nr:Serine/Threonine protein kinases active-site signature [Nakaseomyces glabratus]KAH7583002.1 Serine/Threonine protein kinases active-site signature [Nakaseomyces glabratus]KAH7584426.1 Serine/Threonine protein kinases active-site signature [Nakaseomyces glabratus]KAH7596026.1 Serine/Threonine protein kinases active-site signature [Nakaseomyces glabratus]KAH7611593.1 Serine/Threonine protein kinases active-site signature [Nakaseomyces glabratus]
MSGQRTGSNPRSGYQHVVGMHYAVGPKIGEGSFGVIFEGQNILNSSDGRQGHGSGSGSAHGSGNGNGNSLAGFPVAIKFEPRHSDAPQLRDEFRAYRILNGSKGIPHAYYFGQEGMHNVLIIDLLGPSLEDLFEWCGRKFSIKTTCMLAKQMIERVRIIHDHDLIYRDIKPDNFLISEFQKASNNNGECVKYCAQSAGGDPNLIYMVDFGMAKQYRDPRTKQHIPYRERKSLSGTARYMSINTHFGREQSRRDDLESLGHVFFYFLRGSLPWQGLKAPNNKLKYEKIGLTKQKLNPDELLLSNQIPSQFATYLKYTRSLKFDEDPDYDYLISLMDGVLLSKGYKDDGHYDWMDLNNGAGWDIRVNKRANLHGYGNAQPRNNNNNNNGTKNNGNTGRQRNDSKRTSQQQQVQLAQTAMHSAKNKLATPSKQKEAMSTDKKHLSNLSEHSSDVIYHTLTQPNMNQGYDSMGTQDRRKSQSQHKLQTKRKNSRAHMQYQKGSNNAKDNFFNDQQQRYDSAVERYSIKSEKGLCARICCCFF